MELVDTCAPWLHDKAHSVHSQWGEDGLIAAIFERIEIANGWCFEVGASDGVTFSNTKVLRDDGWHAILIEQDDEQYAKLADYTTSLVTATHANIDAHNLEDVLEFNGAPRDLDFGCIDIDGQDYWVWSGMSRFQPRVVMIEFSLYPADPNFIPELGEAGLLGKRQAGLAAIRELGKSKGYTEVAKTQVNLLFVRDDLL